MYDLILARYFSDTIWVNKAHVPKPQVVHWTTCSTSSIVLTVKLSNGCNLPHYIPKVCQIRGRWLRGALNIGCPRGVSRATRRMWLIKGHRIKRFWSDRNSIWEWFSWLAPLLPLYHSSCIDRYALSEWQQCVHHKPDSGGSAAVLHSPPPHPGPAAWVQIPEGHAVLLPRGFHIILQLHISDQSSCHKLWQVCIE